MAENNSKAPLAIEPRKLALEALATLVNVKRIEQIAFAC